MFNRRAYAELVASDMLVANTKQDYSDSSQSLGTRP